MFGGNVPGLSVGKSDSMDLTTTTGIVQRSLELKQNSTTIVLLSVTVDDQRLIILDGISGV